MDWFDSQGIRRDIEKVYNFKHTLDGDAREWYADYFRQLAKQLNYSDQVLITTLKAAMLNKIYGTLYKMEELSEIIRFCKNYYAKSPAERQKIQEAGKLEANPFKKMQEENPPNINDTLIRLTESLNKMDFTQKPYKPTLYPSGRGRGRGRGGRLQGRKSPGNSQSSYQPHRGRGRGGFRGKPQGGKFDKSPTKRVPRENSKTKDANKDRCRYCCEIGHWVKDCPQKKKDQEKTDSVPSQASVKFPKISMGTNPQKCSMESLKSTKRVRKNWKPLKQAQKKTSSRATLNI